MTCSLPTFKNVLCMTSMRWHFLKMHTVVHVQKLKRAGCRDSFHLLRNNFFACHALHVALDKSKWTSRKMHFVEFFAFSPNKAGIKVGSQQARYCTAVEPRPSPNQQVDVFVCFMTLCMVHGVYRKKIFEKAQLWDLSTWEMNSFLPSTNRKKQKNFVMRCNSLRRLVLSPRNERLGRIFNYFHFNLRRSVENQN